MTTAVNNNHKNKSLNLNSKLKLKYSSWNFIFLGFLTMTGIVCFLTLLTGLLVVPTTHGSENYDIVVVDHPAALFTTLEQERRGDANANANANNHLLRSNSHPQKQQEQNTNNHLDLNLKNDQKDQKYYMVFSTGTVYAVQVQVLANANASVPSYISVSLYVYALSILFLFSFSRLLSLPSIYCTTTSHSPKISLSLLTYLLTNLLRSSIVVVTFTRSHHSFFGILFSLLSSVYFCLSFLCLSTHLSRTTRPDMPHRTLIINHLSFFCFRCNPSSRSALITNLSNSSTKTRRQNTKNKKNSKK